MPDARAEVDLEPAETLRRECKTLQITAGELLCEISWPEIAAPPSGGGLQEHASSALMQDSDWTAEPPVGGEFWTHQRPSLKPADEANLIRPDQGETTSSPGGFYQDKDLS